MRPRAALRSPTPIAAETDQPVLLEDRYGSFVAFIPEGDPGSAEVLVLVHGTPASDTSAEETAQYYVSGWIPFAQQHNLILLAPAFNQEDFSSRLGDVALGGYRGLFGRVIGADDWVLGLVSAYQRAFGGAESSFHLYGLSAGGQYTARFLVRHSERVRRAVITSAVTYPQPTLDVAWPFGMGELHTDLGWDDGTITRADIDSDEEG